MTGPAIQAEARTFFFFFFACQLSAPNQTDTDRVYPRCAILQQGMHLNVFSKVQYDRVDFSCAERNMTGSGSGPPSGTPLSTWEVECPPGEGYPPLTPSPRLVASLPRFDLPMTNPGCTTVTGIAKGHKGPCPPPPWLEYKKCYNLPPNNSI